MRSSHSNTSEFLMQNQVKTHFEGNNFNCRESPPEEYFCTKCNFSTELKASLLEHLKTNHCFKRGNEESDLTVKMYACLQCQFWTYSCLVLIEHQKSFHGEPMENEDRVIEDYIKWYICHHCKFITKLKHNLKGHVLDKHSENRSSSPPHEPHELKNTNSNTLENHFNHSHTIKFSNLNSEKQHKANFKHCDQCKYKTTNVCQLKRHKATRHKTDDFVPLKCSFCDYKTVSTSSLKAHVQKKHTSRRWFECDQCEYKAETLGVMSRHKRREHTKFKCDFCEYTTFSAACLRPHVQYKHNSGGNGNWFGCDQCEFMTRTKKNLAIHRVIHKDIKKFWCDQCGYECKWKAELEIHKMKKHGSSS